MKRKHVSCFVYRLPKEASPSDILEFLQFPNNQLNYDIIHQFSHLKEYLDDIYDSNKNEYKYNNETKSLLAYEHNDKVSYYSLALTSDQLLSQISIDIYWLLYLAGLVKFDDYLSSINENVVIHQLRNAMNQQRLTTDTTYINAATIVIPHNQFSIFLDVISYLLQTAYKDTSSLSSKSIRILQSIIFNHQSILSSLDVYILNFILDIIENSFETFPVLQIKRDHIKHILSRFIEVQIESSSENILYRRVLERYSTEDLISNIFQTIVSKDSISLDDMTSHTYHHSLSNQPSIITTISFLFSLDYSKYSDTICQNIIEIALSSCNEGFAKGVIRSILLMESMWSLFHNPKSRYEIFLEGIFKVNKSIEERLHIVGLSNRMFDYLTLLFLECIPLLSEETLRQTMRVVSLGKSLHVESTEVYLKAGRLRLQNISRYVSIFNGTSAERNILSIDLPRMQAWVSSFQRTGQIPAGLCQQKLLLGANGYKSLLNALSLLIKDQPALDQICFNLIRIMANSDKQFPPAIAEEFIKNKGEIERSTVEAVLCGLCISDNIREFMEIFVQSCIKIEEFLNLDKYFEEIEMSVWMTSQLCNCIRTMFVRSEDKCSCAVSICSVLFSTCSTVINASNTRYRWLVWIRELFVKAIYSNEAAELSCVALLTEGLDRWDADDLTLQQLGVFLYHFNDEMIIKVIECIINQSAASEFCLRISRLNTVISTRIEEELEWQQFSVMKSRPIITLIYTFTSFIYTQGSLSKLHHNCIAYFKNINKCDCFFSLSHGNRIRFLSSTLLTIDKKRMRQYYHATSKYSKQSSLSELLHFLLKAHLVTSECIFSDQQETFDSDDDMQKLYEEFRRCFVFCNYSIEYDEFSEMQYLRDITRALLTFLRTDDAVAWVDFLLVDIMRTSKSTERTMLLVASIEESLELSFESRTNKITLIAFLTFVQKYAFASSEYVPHLANAANGVLVLLDLGVLDSHYNHIMNIKDLLNFSPQNSIESVLLYLVNQKFAYTSMGSASQSNQANLSLDCLNYKLLGWALLPCLHLLGVDIDDEIQFIEYLIENIRQNEGTKSEAQKQVIISLLCSSVCYSISHNTTNPHLAHVYMHCLTVAKILFGSEQDVIESASIELEVEMSGRVAAIGIIELQEHFLRYGSRINASHNLPESTRLLVTYKHLLSSFRK